MSAHSQAIESYIENNPRINSKAAKAIINASAEDRLKYFNAAYESLKSKQNLAYNEETSLVKLLDKLLCQGVELEESVLIALLDDFSEEFRYTALCRYTPFPGLNQLLLAKKSAGKLTDKLVAAIQQARDKAGDYPMMDKERVGWLAGLDKLLDTNPVSTSTCPIEKAADAWTDTLLKTRDDYSKQEKAILDVILEHAATAKGTNPTQKFLKVAAEERAKFDRFEALLTEILESIGTEGPVNVRYRAFYTADKDLISSDYADLLRGLIWQCSEYPATVPLLVKAVEFCYYILGGMGPRCAKTGNACVYALSELATPDATAHLSRLVNVIKSKPCRAQIEKALKKIAEKSNLSRAQIEEMSVLDYGLTGLGTSTEEIGNHVALVELQPPGNVQLSWRDKANKIQKTIPAAVKSESGPQLRKLKERIKAIKTDLPSQRIRIERLLLNDRDIPIDQWRDCYAVHPLIAFFARRLIWQHGDQLFAFKPGHNHPQTLALVDQDDNAWGLPSTGSIRLWHPADSPARVVEQWREWLFRNEISQPFKQAHREIYLLTPAEEETDLYSNRFAAHLIRQHQFKKLCESRNWRCDYQGEWDCNGVAEVQLKDEDWRVQFLTQPAGDLKSPAGVYLHLATDQVRFYRFGENEACRLTEVPARIFTELMRDIDLFVSVSSIGNDPEWRDQGYQPQHNNNWESQAFGDLNHTAKSRREVLEKLLPRLKIAKQCKLTDRFLVVEGKIRTYHIHLGSGNIKMEPNQEYLCIVAKSAKRSANSNIFLPFEGDRMLSIILSKAFMLAADTRIKDPLIVAQIKG